MPRSNKFSFKRTWTVNLSADKTDDIEVGTNFGCGIMNDEGNAWSEEDVEIEHNEGYEILEELTSNKIFDELQAYNDDCGKTLSFINRVSNLIKFSSFLRG